MRNFLIVIFSFVIFACAPLEKASRQVSLTCYAGATLIDGTGSNTKPGQSIIVQGERITEIGPNICQRRDISKIVDVTGRTIIPGLIDAHVHLSSPRSPNPDESLAFLLKNGVTSIREMGGNVPLFTELQSEIESGSRIGPDIYTTANVFGASFMSDPRRLGRAILAVRHPSCDW